VLYIFNPSPAQENIPFMVFPTFKNSPASNVVFAAIVPENLRLFLVIGFILHILSAIGSTKEPNGKMSFVFCLL